MRTRIRRFVQDEILSGRAAEDLHDDEDLLMSGLVDSLGMMRLVAFIGDELGISVPPEDVTIEDFSTIAAITNYLGARGDAHD